MRRFSEELALVNEFTREVPVNVELLAKSLGIEVIHSSMSDEVSGMIEHVGDNRYRIVVNDNHPATRKRFTIAHELGHYFRHRHLIGDGISDDKLYRSSELGAYRNTAIGRRQETEANQFAATILMPKSALEQFVSESGINDPAVIAKKIGVSKQAYCIRMGLDYSAF